MKKALLIAQIILGVALLVFLIYRFYFQTYPPLIHDPSSWKNWEGFYVLSYTGLSKEEGTSYLSGKGFGDHLAALKEAGFVPLAPEDVAAFYRQGHPLPPKGVLILFEGGRKDSFLLATQVLKKNGFIATMAVPTALVQSKDTFYLKIGDLKKLQRSPYWRLASMGHEAYKKITIDAQGRSGHFLSARLFEKGKQEDDALYQQRVLRDYRQAASLLGRITGKPVVAYLYPYADAGLGPQADPLAAGANRQALRELHAIAFVSAHQPFNGPETDPWQLNRLRVPPAWDGRQLVRQLANFTPRTTTIDGAKEVGVWQSDKPLTLQEGALVLPADSLHWVKGTETWGDQEVDFRISLPPRSSLNLFLRYQGKHAYLVLHLASGGTALREQQKEGLQTLARTALTMEEKQKHRLKVFIKANRAWCWQDERLLFGPIPLSTSLNQGKIGLMTQGGEVRLHGFTARPLAGTYIFSDAYQTLPQPLQYEARAVLIPAPGGFPPAFFPEKRRKDILKAAAEGVQTIPLLSPPPSSSRPEREAYAARWQEAVADPLLRPFIRTLALSGADAEWISLFQHLGFQVVAVVSPGEAEKIASEKRRPAADWVLIDGPDQAARTAADRLLSVFPARKIIVTAASREGLPQGVVAALRLKTEGGGK